jgi:hypothetical protein
MIIIGIVVDVYSHFWPGIIVAKIFKGFGSAGVPCSQNVMVLL